MTKKLWVRYFEEINNRKPTIEEIHLAMQQGEIKMNFFDKILYYGINGTQLANPLKSLVL